VIVRASAHANLLLPTGGDGLGLGNVHDHGPRGDRDVLGSDAVGLSRDVVFVVVIVSLFLGIIGVLVLVTLLFSAIFVVVLVLALLLILVVDVADFLVFCRIVFGAFYRVVGVFIFILFLVFGNLLVRDFDVFIVVLGALGDLALFGRGRFDSILGILVLASIFVLLFLIIVLGIIIGVLLGRLVSESGRQHHKTPHRRIQEGENKTSQRKRKHSLFFLFRVLGELDKLLLLGLALTRCDNHLDGKIRCMCMCICVIWMSVTRVWQWAIVQYVVGKRTESTERRKVRGRGAGGRETGSLLYGKTRHSQLECD
jgi:hypothetical protein